MNEEIFHLWQFQNKLGFSKNFFLPLSCMDGTWQCAFDGDSWMISLYELWPSLLAAKFALGITNGTLVLNH